MKWLLIQNNWLSGCLRMIFGVLLIAGAVCFWCNARSSLRKTEDIISLEQQLDALPDHDYIAEIRQLIKDKRYGEAIILCEDVQKAELPCAAEAAALKADAARENKSIWNRIYKSGRAFITGNPDGSIEEIGGSIASDMLMYGDVRDLVKQGYFKLTKQETDPLIAALAAVGLLTEFVDVADWAPAALKAMKKAGAITRKLADSLLTMCKKIIKTRKMDGAAKAFFKNTKNMLDSSGFIRTKNIFKHVDQTDDLALLAAKAKGNAAVTHLVSKHAGKESVDVLKNASPGFVKKLVRKGRLAVRFMKVYHKHHAVIEKTFWQKIPKSLVNGFAVAFSSLGALLLLSGAIPLFWRKRKKTASI